MSWDADLGDHEWNYTHNTNGMIEEALERAGKTDSLAKTGEPWWSNDSGGMGKRAWWDLLDARSASDGSDLLWDILSQLRLDPAHFRAMNPGNGWGDYDSLVNVLLEMSIAGKDPENASEVWETSG